MREKYSECDIALELLPLYIEQQTGQESNLFLERHLAECEACHKAHQMMVADFSAQIGKCGSEEGAERKNQKRKKKFFNSRRKKIMILVLFLVGYALLMAGIVIYTFMKLTTGVI